MADLMDEDAEPAAAAPASLATAPDARQVSAGHMASAPVSGPDVAVPIQQHDDGGAAPLSMQLSMSELLGEDDSQPVTAPQADALAASAQPASDQAAAHPPHAAPAPSSALETPVGTDGPQAVVSNATEGGGDGCGSAPEGMTQQRAAYGKDARLPDPLAVQDSGYEADIEAAVKGEPSGAVDREAMDALGLAGGQLANLMNAVAASGKPDEVAAMLDAGPTSNA